MDVSYPKADIHIQKLTDQKQVKNVEYFNYFLIAW